MHALRRTCTCRLKIINAPRLPLAGGVCTKYSSGAADQIQRLGPGWRGHAEGQKYAARGMFRSTVSRRRPSSGPISPVCLPWNAATDSNSSLEQRGIIWKRVAKSTRRLWATPPPPRYSGPFGFGSAVCSMHQSAVGDCRMLALIQHLGACVFRVRSHRLKEITYRGKQWGGGTLPILVQPCSSAGGVGWGGAEGTWLQRRNPPKL